jgi:hypothetical protein
MALTTEIAPPSGRQTTGSRATALLVVGLLLVASLIAVGLVVGADVSSDEGSYLEAAREAVSGRILYRDFGYSQGPVVPLVTGTLLKLFGFAFLAQRALNALFGLAALGVILLLARAEEGGLPLRTTGLALVVSTSLLHNVSIGNTYGLTSLLLALACAAAIRIRRYRTRVAAASALAALAFGCRLPVAPFVAVFVVALLFKPFSWRTVVVSFAVSLGVLLVVFGPFLLIDASNVAFWTIGYHRATSLSRPRADFFREAWALCPALPLLLAAGLVAWGRLGWRPRAGDAAPGLLLASLAAIGFHVLLPVSYGGYLTPFVGPAVLASSILISRGLSAASRRAIEIGVVVMAVAGAFLVRPDFNPGAVEDLRAVAHLLRATTPPGGVVITTMPETAVEAHRPCLPGLEDGKFGFTDTMSAEQASRRRLMDVGRLVGVLERGEAAAIVFSRFRNWNFGWSAPSLAPTRLETRDALRRAIDARYDLVYQGPAYIVFLPRAAPQGPGLVRPGDKMSR